MLPLILVSLLILIGLTLFIVYCLGILRNNIAYLTDHIADALKNIENELTFLTTHFGQVYTPKEFADALLDAALKSNAPPTKKQYEDLCNNA